jgi:hypothetical protein
MLSNPVAQVVPAGIHDILSLAGRDPRPFTVLAVAGAIDLYAPAFIMGQLGSVYFFHCNRFSTKLINFNIKKKRI